MSRDTHYPRIRVDTFRLGAALQAVMRQRGISLRVAAREMDISPATLQRLGNEYRAVGADTFMTMCWWLGEDPLRFIFDARRWRNPSSNVYERLNPDISAHEMHRRRYPGPVEFPKTAPEPVTDEAIHEEEFLRPDHSDEFPTVLRVLAGMGSVPGPIVPEDLAPPFTENDSMVAAFIHTEIDVPLNRSDNELP